VARSAIRFRDPHARQRERKQLAAHREAVRIERTVPEDWFRILTGIYAAGQLQELSLPCSVIPENDHRLWRTIWSTDKSVVALEIQHGSQRGRTEYNFRCLDEVARTGRPVVGSYGGFFDVFVPLLNDGVVVGHLASGPLSRHDLTEHDIRERWTSMTGRPALASDPELLRYAAIALDTPVLDRSALAVHTQFLVELARGLAGTEELGVVRARHRKINRAIRQRNQFAAMWELSHGLTDPAAQGFWSADFREWCRAGLGMSRLPNVVVAVGRQVMRDEDPLQAIVASRRFTERCSEVAFRFPDTICGRAGESTPYLLTSIDSTRTEDRASSAVRRMLDEVRRNLRRSTGIEVRFGVSRAADPRGLPRSLDEAIVALEWATHERLDVAVHGDEAPRRAAARPMIFSSLQDILNALREQAGRSDVPIVIDRLTSDVVWRSGASVASARAYVESFYAQIAHTVRDSGWLESRVTEDRVKSFHVAIDEAVTVQAVIRAFREHVMLQIDAVRRPSHADREGKLARATRYVEAHLDRSLSLREVARVAGYAPSYFSRVFGDLYGQTFEHWVLAARIARARQLLRTTQLDVGRVRVACGFTAKAYFYRAFRRATGATPIEYRRGSANTG
jgi:AraC-like DNA-binding protein